MLSSESAPGRVPMGLSFRRLETSLHTDVLPVKCARLERKTTRKKVCAERLLANGNNEAKHDI